MKKPILATVSVMLVASLVVPGIAFAQGNGKNQGGAARGKAARVAVASAQQEARNDKAAEKAAHAQAKAERVAAKAERKAAKAAEKQARKALKPTTKAAAVSAAAEATEVVGGDDASGSVEPSVEATHGPGIAVAFSRITSNLEKSLDKMAAGKKKQLPPGLIRVWNKFASWLGVDLTTRPGYVAPSVPTSTVEPTSTVTPTSTVEPTPTVTPTPTVEPSGTVF